MGKYNPLSRSRIGRDKAAHRQEYPDYKSRVEVANAAALSGEVDVEFLRHLETPSEVAALEQRWTNSWVSPLRARYVMDGLSAVDADRMGVTLLAT